MTFPSKHANYYTIQTLYILYLCNHHSIWPPSLIFIISQLGPPFGALFFPYWAGQISPSNALKSGCALPLMASISGHFRSKWAFRLIWGFLRLLGGSGDGTSICLNINSIEANPLVRYGSPGEGVKRVK